MQWKKFIYIKNSSQYTEHHASNLFVGKLMNCYLASFLEVVEPNNIVEIHIHIYKHIVKIHIQLVSFHNKKTCETSFLKLIKKLIKLLNFIDILILFIYNISVTDYKMTRPLQKINLQRHDEKVQCLMQTAIYFTCIP